MKFSTNGGRHQRRERASAWPPWTTSTSRSRLDGVDEETNDVDPRRRHPRQGAPGDGPPARRRLPAVQDLGGHDPPQRRPARRLRGARRPSTAPSCASPASARRAAAPTPGTSCTRPTEQQVRLYHWLLDRGPTCSPATRSSTSPRWASPLPGLNLCGAGRVVCLIDPVGDVYACPFVIHDEFKAGSVRDDRAASPRCGAPRPVHRRCASRPAPGALRVLRQLRRLPGGCMAAKFFTGLPLDGPDPECVQGPRRATLLAWTAAGCRGRRGPRAPRSAPATRHAVARVRAQARFRSAVSHGRRGPRDAASSRSTLGTAHAHRTGCCSARTRPTSAGAGRSRTATSPTTSGGRRAAAASS